MTPLNSSVAKGASYDDAKQRLTVHFQNGGVYHYHNVPREHFDNLISAESPGGYLATHIKGKFGTRKDGE